MRMNGTTVHLGELAWESAEDPAPGGGVDVRWKLLFSGHRTPTGLLSMGMAEIRPGGLLPLHRHAPAEIYHVLEGHGQVEIEGARHPLRPGGAVFIPPDAWHETLADSGAPLRFLFVFSADSFEEIQYEFADGG